MTEAEFNILADPGFRALVREFEAHSPESLAFTAKLSGKYPPALLATQVNLRQKAKSKLPSWYEAGCVFILRSLEQATNEQIAKLKQTFTGETCLDLTCGLGVDSWNFSKNYSKVISLEPDPLLVQLARLNFSLLGADNIKVIQSRAEDYEMNSRFDLIYADPSRRDENDKRNFLPEQGSPNIPALLPVLLKSAKKIVVKNSPLLDVTAASAYPHIQKISVLGAEGECKEVLLEFCDTQNTHAEKEAVYYFKNVTHRVSSNEKKPDFKNEFPKDGFIVEADVTVYKAGLGPDFFAGTGLDGWMQNAQGYFFSKKIPENIPAKTFRIIRPLPFKPATWKKELAAGGIEKILLTKRGLDIPLDQIRKEMKLKEGGNYYLVLCGKAATGRAAFLCERIF